MKGRDTIEILETSLETWNSMEPPFKVDFIGIGAPKCGSTWLFYALGQHPKICLSEPKEIRFFDRENYPDPKASHRGNRPVCDSENTKNLASYARHYKHCPAGSIKGEFTVRYLFDDNAPSNIHRHFPNVKLLACLRNPVDSLYSSFWGRSQYSLVDKNATFEQAIERDSRYLRKGYYAKHLKRYLEYFKREQIKIVLFDDIVENPEKIIRDVFEFLELDSIADLDLGRIPKNSAKKSRLPFSPEPVMRKFASFLVERDQAALLHRMRELGLKKLLLELTTVEHPRQPIDPQTRDRLRRLFHDDICELEILLDRDLTAWK